MYKVGHEIQPITPLPLIDLMTVSAKNVVVSLSYQNWLNSWIDGKSRPSLWSNYKDEWLIQIL